MSTAVAEKTIDHVPANVAPEADTFMAIIERAARDPNVDIDKMERLMAMRERALALSAEQAFNVAMTAAQTEMGRVQANKLNPQTKSMYATYDKLDAVLRPIYTKHGFALSFDEGDAPDSKPDHVRVVCFVSHVAGHTRTYHRDMPADGKGAKGGDVMTKTHAAGAAGSYGARYLLKGIFNVAIGEDDKDGNAPKDAGPKITDAELDELVALAEKAGTTVEKLCEIARVQWLEDLPASQFAITKKSLLTRIAERASKPQTVDPTGQFDQMERGK